MLDASAVLAYVLGEPGAEWLAKRIGHSAASVINVEEVLATMAARGHDVRTSYDDLLRLDLEVLPFEPTDAMGTAELRPRLASRGLSLGDRACLFAAKRRGLSAVTADGNWTMTAGGSVPKRAKLEGVTVIQLRPRGGR